MYKAMTMLHNFKEGKAWTDGQFGLHKPPSCLSATQVEQNGCCDIEGKTRAHLWGWGTTWYDEQDEKRAATEIPLFAPRSKYHLSNWPLSRERLIPRLVWLLFFSVSQFYYRSCHGHLLPLPPSWSLRDFFRTLIQGFVVFVQGLPLNSDFWNGVHSVDESVISSRTRDVDLFKSIARVFLDSPRLPPCSLILNILHDQIENTNFLHALVLRVRKLRPRFGEVE